MKRFLPFIAAFAFLAAWPATYLVLGGNFLNIGGGVLEVSAAPTVPAAPTIGTATRGNAQATVTFTPGSNGGSTITGYTITSSVGPTASVAGSPGVITGLTNGTAQTFTVTATNAVGTSAASGASNSVTPATVPGAPTIGTATAGNAQATVPFTAPGSNGGSAITGYAVTGSPSGSASGSSSPITVTGLTNGTAYTFTVTATNAVGTGAASSASNSVTPTSGTVSTAPSIVTVFQASSPNTVVVRWKHPSNYLTLRSGGIPVQSYTVQILNASSTVVGSTTVYPFIVDQNTNPATSFVGTLTSGSAVITGITTRNTGLTTGQAVIDRFGYIPSGTTVSSFTTSPSGGTYTVTLSANATGTDTYQRIGFNQSGKAAVWSQLNAKGTVTGLPTTGAPFTAVVTGNNVNGAGSSGSSGNSVTPVTTSSFYMFSGPGTSAPSSTGYACSGNANGSGYANGSVVGNHDFGNCGTWAQYGVAAGTTSHNGLSSAPTNNVDATKNVWEADGISGSSAASQSYVVEAFPTLSGANQNGTLQMSAFSKLTITVQPQSNQPIGLYINQPFVAMVLAGTVTSASTGTTITDANLALPTNAVGAGTAGGYGLANISSSAWSSTGQSNTATTLTMQNAITVANDDFYEVSIGDVNCGKGINNIGAGSIPSGATGPTTMTQGSPNTYVIPLTDLDDQIDSVSVSNPIISTGELFKISIAMATPSANSNWYLWAVGMTP